VPKWSAAVKVLRKQEINGGMRQRHVQQQQKRAEKKRQRKNSFTSYARSSFSFAFQSLITTEENNSQTKRFATCQPGYSVNYS